MLALFSNSASATLASAITTSSTVITVSTGMGAMFPTITADTYFMATLTDSSNNLEVVKVTGRTSDVLTVARAQEGTVAHVYSAGDKIEIRITASSLNGFAQLNGTQAITGNKTFSGTNTFTGTNSFTGANTFSGNTVFDLGTTTISTLAGPVAGTFTFSGNVTFSNKITGNISGNADGSSTSLVTTNFSIAEAGGKLVFYNGTTAIASINSTGDFVALSTVKGGATP